MNCTFKLGVRSVLMGLILMGGVACQGDNQTNAAAQAGAPSAPTTLPQTIAPAGTADEPVDSGPAVSTASATPAATPSDQPTASATWTATATVSPSPSPTASATMSPTASPSPSPTATAVPTVALPEWLSYLNRFRAIADLPPLSDQEAYTLGSRLHSRYMVANDDPIAHSEEPDNPYFDEAGDQAARNGNLFATGQMEANYIWSINFWVSAPFHLIGLLDPHLQVVGYGDYVEEIGDTRMAGVLDIGSHPAGTAEGVTYPIMFPGDGSETWVVRHSMYEWPDPFGGCPGYAAPTGPPIVLMLGNGSTTPEISSHRLAMGNQPLESCLFDETSYRNNDPYAEQIGRQILDLSDAVVIMPRNPLAIDQTYHVQVTNRGETITWSFSTRRGPD